MPDPGPAAAGAAAGGATGGGLIADAFGLHDPGKTAPSRRAWSGLVGMSQWSAPGPVQDLVLFAGPKSLVAGKDQGHVAAIALDRFGNMVEDGTPAVVTLSQEARASPIRGGIADLLVGPLTQAGEVPAGASAGRIQSPRAVFRIMADIDSVQPVLAASPATVAAETAVGLGSGRLADRFGNGLPTGTGGSVLLRHEDGAHSLIPMLALDGQMRGWMISRDIPGKAEARLALGARQSAGAAMTVKAPLALGLPEIRRARLADIGAHQLTIGPFRTTDGFALLDGAEVSVLAVLRGGAELRGRAWTRDGMALLVLPVGPADEITRFEVSSPLGPMDLTAAWRAAPEEGAADAAAAAAGRAP